MNDCYRQLGICIKDTIKIENKKKIDELKGSLILLPPSLSKGSYLKNFKNTQTAFASGWMSIRALRKRSGYDKGFAISMMKKYIFCFRLFYYFKNSVPICMIRDCESFVIS